MVGAIALPVSEMGLDPQAAVEAKLEVRDGCLIQTVSFSPKKKKKVIKLIDEPLMKK